jgi:hypothetical protein
MEKLINTEDLREFEVWKAWRNGGLMLGPERETLEEVVEKLKGKELFKESNDRARKMLSEIKSLPMIETAETEIEINSTGETWEDIEKDYLKEEYPVFGGPFTGALTPFEWLKKYFNSPKRR